MFLHATPCCQITILIIANFSQVLNVSPKIAYDVNFF